MVKPKQLKRGSKVAVISPSWGGPAVYPDIYEMGLEVLKGTMEFQVVEFPTARMTPEELYNNPGLRAKDINDAFADNEIEAVFASIGGDESIRILPFLNLEVILNNPKILMGYSDTTTLLTYLNFKGLVTFHGPSVMAGWAQINSYECLAGYYKSILTENLPARPIATFDQLSEGYPDWGVKATLGKVNPKKDNTRGWVWLQGERPVSGRLWGGCIEVLDFLKGTPYWPCDDFWHNRVMMLETSEEKPLPRYVGYSLRSWGMMGLFDKIAALFIGHPMRYSQEEQQELYEIVINIVAKEFGHPELPIVANMNFGHTDPNLILPLGIEVSVDPGKKEIALTEKMFAT